MTVQGVSIALSTEDVARSVKFYVEQLFYGGSLLIALAASALVERRRRTVAV